MFTFNLNDNEIFKLKTLNVRTKQQQHSHFTMSAPICGRASNQFNLHVIFILKLVLSTILFQRNIDMNMCVCNEQIKRTHAQRNDFVYRKNKLSKITTNAKFGGYAQEET